MSALDDPWSSDVDVSDDFLTMPGLVKERSSSILVKERSSSILVKDSLDVVSCNDDMFSKCFESGVFCYDMSLNDEGSTEPKAHYHCPSCLIHCENRLNFITSHYNECTADHPKVLVPTICHHDSNILFTECKSGDDNCPVFGAGKVPTHYHCPCCLFFAHQNVFLAIKHQLNCCKSMMSWNPGNVLPEAETSNTVCNHLDESDVKFEICYKSDSGCHGERKRECHFHCPCCDNFSDSKLTQLKNHQRSCCKLSDENFPRPTYLRMNFVLNIATGIDQRLINGNILDSDRKRKNLNNPIKLEKLDDCFFSKCVEKLCETKNSHYHCPLCKTYTSRRIKLLKKHYMKCINDDTPRARSSKRAKLFARTAVGELQCVVVDKSNGVFLVRGSLTGPGMPAHVIYKPPHQYNCDDGCRNSEYDAQCCKHLDACATFVQNGVVNNYHQMSSEVQNVKVLGSLLRMDKSSKEQIVTLFQQCHDLGVPVIKHFKPVNVSSRYPCYIFLSVSSCTSPRYYTRSGRVKVTFSVKKNQFKCKCLDSQCVHELVSKLYLEHNHIVDSPKYEQCSFKQEPG